MGLFNLFSSKQNINKIYKTDKISGQNKILLLFYFIMHWIIMIGLITYFIWRKPKYDIYLLYFFIFFLLTWTVVYNDCMFSYYEKKIIGEIIDITNMRNPSLNLYCDTNFITILLDTIIIIGVILNFAYIMLINNFQNYLIFLFLFFLIPYILFYRCIDLQKIIQTPK